MTTETLDDVIRQLDLFSMAEKQTAPAHNSTPTSALAAMKAIKKVKGQKLAILQELARRDSWEKRGLIQDEACAFFGKETGTINPRFNELHDDKYIDTLLFTRQTRAKKDARVYVITSKGREVLEASLVGIAARGSDVPEGEGYPRESVAGANGSGTVHIEGGDVLEGDEYRQID